MVLGVAIGGETVTPLEWGAAAVISAGVLLLALRR
jgi:drug/metabolite transporter (DMT)-like permease